MQKNKGIISFIHSFYQAFLPALNGIALAWESERSFRIHVSAILLVSMGGIGFGLDTKEWAIVFLTYAVLTGLELLNSAIESLANYVQPEEHPAMKRAKDLAAGAVLCAAIFAVAIGILLFLPKILQHLSQA